MIFRNKAIGVEIVNGCPTVERREVGQQRSELTSYLAYIKWKMPQNRSLDGLSHVIPGSYPSYLGLSSREMSRCTIEALPLPSRQR